MYKSYLQDIDNPSDIEFIRRINTKIYKWIETMSYSLEKREYSKDVENKILDEGYLLQYCVMIKSDRKEVLASIIQDVFSKCDYHNRMIPRTANCQYPYLLYVDEFDFKHHILSKNEIK